MTDLGLSEIIFIGLLYIGVSDFWKKAIHVFFRKMLSPADFSKQRNWQESCRMPYSIISSLAYLPSETYRAVS